MPDGSGFAASPER